MGGIVAADTVLSLATDTPLDSSAPPDAFNTNLFPHIQGVLAFDTPYLGISPGVVAHGAEGHYNAASSAFTQISSLSGALWGAKNAADASKTDEKKKEKIAGALPAPSIAETSTAAVASTKWGSWGKIAMLAGAASIAAAGGTAAYLNREHITSGWSWVFSHLEFVGCLMKPEQLNKRTAMMVRLNEELHIGFANLYTRLGKKAMSQDGKGNLVGAVMGNRRTFCNLPSRKESMGYFMEAINDAAHDETGAHMSEFVVHFLWFLISIESPANYNVAMFYPKDNPGYYSMSESAKKLIITWSSNDWYESSSGKGMKAFEKAEHQEL